MPCQEASVQEDRALTLQGQLEELEIRLREQMEQGQQEDERVREREEAQQALEAATTAAAEAQAEAQAELAEVASSPSSNLYAEL